MEEEKCVYFHYPFATDLDHSGGEKSQRYCLADFSTAPKWLWRHRHCSLRRSGVDSLERERGWPRGTGFLLSTMKSTHSTEHHQEASCKYVNVEKYQFLDRYLALDL